MNDKKTTGVLKIPDLTHDVQRDPPPAIAREKMRGHLELQLLAKQVAANASLMNKYHATIGCEDDARMRDMIDQVRNYARGIDPTLTYAEGASLALLLSNFDDSGTSD